MRIPAWLSVRQWSLRARLLVCLLGLVAVALLITSVVGTALLRGYLTDQVDRQLMVATTFMQGRPASGAPGGRLPDRPAGSPFRPAQDQLPTPLWFTELNPNGAVVSQRGGPQSPNEPRPDLSHVTTAKVLAEEGDAFTVPATRGASGFRVRAVEQPDRTGARTVAISLESVDSTVHRLWLISLLVALGVLALLFVLAWIALRMSLRPLAAVEQTAEQIAAGDLSRRVPAGRPGTEIGRLAKALNGMLAQIETAFAARHRSEMMLRRFVADASHELRTPLTTVRGYAELARKGALSDPSAHERALTRIESEAARMGGLVDDLLLLAHLDQQRPLDVATVDLIALTTDAVADARVQAPDRRIDFATPDRPVLVDVDADRMRQVLANLLGNAFVHTPAGTPVHVSLSRDGHLAELAVADEGPGMPPEQAERVFERFYRADISRSRARGGAGLGLSIVAAVVQASGGTVTCSTAPGSGTTFRVGLPLRG